MKVALVCAYDFAYPGGVGSHITSLYHELMKAGLEVKIIAPYSGQIDPLKNKDLIPIGKSFPVPSAGAIARITLSPFLKSQVKEVLKAERFDVIHLHEPLYSTITLTVLRHSTSINIGTFHAFQKTRFPWHLISPFFKGAWNRLHGRIAVSEPAKRFISRYFPYEYKIIPNGIDFDRFSKDITPIEGLRDGKLNILFVGRAEKRKGLIYLLEAYRSVKQELPESRLIVVGPGNREKFETEVKKMGLEDVVFTDYVSNEELPAYYHSADVFCSPATGGESFGIILLEAMAASRPVVASEIDGYASLMRHGSEGLMVPPKDPSSLAHALIELLQDETRRREMGMRGREKAAHYSWSNVARMINEYYIYLYNNRSQQ